MDEVPQMKKNLSHIDDQLWREKNSANTKEFEKSKQAWQRSEKLLRAMVFRLSLLSTVDDLPFINRLEALRTSLDDGLPSLTLKPLFDDISGYIQKLESAGRLTGRNLDQADEISRQPLSLMLLGMIGSVPYPSAFLQRLEPIKALLRFDVDENTNNNFLRSLEAYFEVQEDFYRSIQDEKEKMQTYLHGLTNQLMDINKNIKMTVSIQQDSMRAGTEIDSAVSTEVSKLEDSISIEFNMKSLKLCIEKRIKTIRNCMSEYRVKEEARHSQSTAMIEKLNQRLRLMEKEAEQLRTQLLEKNKQYLSDSLTGIPNRNAYEDRIQQECERHVYNNIPVCMMICDVDNFKNINDTYGHAAGDKVLREIADVLRKNIRSTDFVARFGGEEFAIIIPGATLGEGNKVAETLRRAIEQFPFRVKNNRLPVTISGGVAQFREHDSPASLFERADNEIGRAHV